MTGKKNSVSGNINERSCRVQDCPTSSCKVAIAQHLETQEVLPSRPWTCEDKDTSNKMLGMGFLRTLL